MNGRERSADGPPRAGPPLDGTPTDGAHRHHTPVDHATDGDSQFGVPLDTELLLPDTVDTEALGERLAAGLGAGDLVVLSGPLGAGKTALVRGLARGLGVGGPVTSPTFVIAREHRPLPGGAGVPLVHVDAYRLAATVTPGPAVTSGPAVPAGSDVPSRSDVAAQLDDLDLDTDLDGAVVAVEWGEGVAERLSARHLLVRLDRRPDDVRVATVHRVQPA
jgi:tRNA threonylcarbamoyladenosine biosynthesis protein TsaE